MEARRFVPFLLILSGFLYFVLRDQQTSPQVDEPEEALIAMVQALKAGDVSGLLRCFGGELGRRLEGIIEKQGRADLEQWLKRRGQAVKGLAILNKESRGANEVLVFTETVYEGRNKRQSFLLRRIDGRWKVVSSDFEAVSDWETDFGKSIQEVG